MKCRGLEKKKSFQQKRQKDGRSSLCKAGYVTYRGYEGLGAPPPSGHPGHGELLLLRLLLGLSAAATPGGAGAPPPRARAPPDGLHDQPAGPLHGEGQGEVESEE